MTLHRSQVIQLQNQGPGLPVTLSVLAPPAAAAQDLPQQPQRSPQKPLTQRGIDMGASRADWYRRGRRTEPGVLCRTSAPETGVLYRATRRESSLGGVYGTFLSVYGLPPSAFPSRV